MKQRVVIGTTRVQQLERWMAFCDAASNRYIHHNVAYPHLSGFCYYALSYVVYDVIMPLNNDILTVTL